MKPSPTIAIAIPAFKAAATIGETLDALQKNEALGKVSFVAILNDCSPDDTVAVARSHWFSSVPLEVWDNAKNMGERRTTNAAIVRIADLCDWTVILHADDVVKPSWLGLYVAELDKLPVNVASICSSYDNWWPDTGVIESGEDFPDRPAVHVRGEADQVIRTMAEGCWWHLSGCMIRNKSFLDIGGFEPDMPQLGDWEWLLRCLAKGYGIWYLPRSIMLYRQHGNSISSRSFREARDFAEKLQIYLLMMDKGYLSEVQHRALLRSLMRQLARRTMVRLVRGDTHGFRCHSSILVETGFDYVRRRLFV